MKTKQNFKAITIYLIYQWISGPHQLQAGPTSSPEYNSTKLSILEYSYMQIYVSWTTDQSAVVFHKSTGGGKKKISGLHYFI
jgi:hypothetical protein